MNRLWTSFPGDVDTLVIPVLCDVGKKKAEAKRGSFGSVEKGWPTFSFAVPIAPHVLGVDRNLVPVATQTEN